MDINSTTVAEFIKGALPLFGQVVAIFGQQPLFGCIRMIFRKGSY